MVSLLMGSLLLFLSSQIQAQELGSSIGQSQLERTSSASWPKNILTEMKLRGRIHAQFGQVMAEDARERFEGNTSEIRRLRLGVDVPLSTSFAARAEANIPTRDGDRLNMRSAYLRWKINPAFGLKLGYDKPIFGDEENTSSASILTVERSLISNIAAPGEQKGLTFEGSAGVLHYGASVAAYKLSSSEVFDDTRYMHTLSTGLDFSELLGSNEDLSFRLDFLHNDQRSSYNFKRGSSLSARYRINLLELRSEFIRLEGDSGRRVRGGYFMPSYNLSDHFKLVARYEMTLANQNEGITSAARYTNRLSDLETRSELTRGKAYRALYLGSNYYFSGDHHKIMAGLERSVLETSLDQDLEAYTFYGAWRVLF